MPVADSIRRRVVVHGRVQGVFFRDSIRERAHGRGVRGWVCNRADGAVEAVFEGSVDEIDSVVSFCQRGPSGADVADVEVIEEEPEGLSGFEVR